MKKTRRRAGRQTVWIKRAVVLALTGLGLYVVWPSLAAVFSSGPQLKHVNPLWGIPIVLAELASFACMWALLRLALDVKPWFPVATAQLAGNAFSRIVPGGAAAGENLPDQLRIAQPQPCFAGRTLDAEAFHEPSPTSRPA